MATRETPAARGERLKHELDVLLVAIDSVLDDSTRLNTRLPQPRTLLMDDQEDTDGCALDFNEEDADPDEVAELRPLFPDGNPAKAKEWGELFGGAEGASGEAP